MTKAIRVQNVSKVFKITPYRVDSLRQNLQRSLQFIFTRKVPFTALSNIDFSVEEGEVFGIIGRNGSGKSTLLKILSKIMMPTSGRVELYGKINTLLEVGTGFHPELTGRENIFLNGSILGLKRAEIRTRFDEIVSFSEVETFLDTPVKHYSSGMFVRLAFSVAAHLDPDILIVDEVLSVGDAAFQKKCIQKMEEEVLQGRTVLFVSHNMEQVQKLSSRVLLLHQGRVHDIGSPEKIIGRYLQGFQMTENILLENAGLRRGSGRVRIESIQVLDYREEKCDLLLAGEEYFFRLFYYSEKAELSEMDFRLLIKTRDNYLALILSSRMHISASYRMSSRGIAQCRLKKWPLNTGVYSVDVEIYHRGELSDQIINVLTFESVKGPFYPTGDLPESTVPVLADDEWKMINR